MADRLRLTFPVNFYFQDYLAFKAEVDRRDVIYEKLKEKVKTGSAVQLTPEQFKPLEIHWKRVTNQKRMWLSKLDSSLPGKLGKFGEWLNLAEEILEREEKKLESPEEMTAQLKSILLEHKVSLLMLSLK